MGLLNDIGDTFDIDVRASSKRLLEIVKESEDDYELVELFEDFIIAIIQKTSKKYSNELEEKNEKIKGLIQAIDNMKAKNEYY